MNTKTSELLAKLRAAKRTTPAIPTPPVEPISIPTSQPTPLTLADQVKEGLATMAHELTQTVPNIKTVLRTIHGQLKRDPEIVTLLSDKECAVLVSGLKDFTKLALSTTVAAKKVTGLRKTTVGDL